MMEQFSKTLIENFKGLLFFLKKTNVDFEEVADEIDNSPLREALNGLSAETNFFEHEIKLQLQKLGLDIDDRNIATSSMPLKNDISTKPGEELVSIFSQFEQFLLKYYNNLILENLPCKDLRKTIIYQMNALKLTFMKLNMLNDARFKSLTF